MNYENLLTKESNKRITHVTIQEDDTANYDDKESIELQQKLTQLELKFVQQSSEHNDEITTLHSQITKLRSSFEKNEVLRHKLEYELTIARKDKNHEHRSFSVEKDNLQNHVEKLKRILNQKDSELESEKNCFAEERQLFQSTEQNYSEQTKKLEATILNLQSNNEILRGEKIASEQLAVVWKSKHNALEEKTSALNVENDYHVNTIQKLMRDLEYSKQRENELIERRKSLEAKVSSFASSVETEKTAHLEAKFNTEVLQLRVKDLENLFSNETSNLKDCKNKLDEAINQCRDLESVLATERESLGKLQVVNKHLTDRLHAKSLLVSKTSEETTKQEKEILELQQQLQESNKKLTHHENNRNATINELKFLLNNYPVIADVAKSPDKTDHWNFTGLIEQIRQIFEDYQVKLAEQDKQLCNAMENMEKLNTECKTRQEMEWTRDKALQEAEKLVQIAQQKYTTCQSNCMEYETKMGKLENENMNMKGLIKVRDECIERLHIEIHQLHCGIEGKTKRFCITLENIYELLLTGSTQHMPSDGSHTITELEHLIVKLVKDDVNNNRDVNHKFREIQAELVKTKDEVTQYKAALHKLQKLNKQVLIQTEKSLLDSQLAWSCEKDELLNQYNEEQRKLKEHHEKLRKEETGRNGNLKEQLKSVESNNQRLLLEIRHFKHDKKTVNTIINILTGALFAMMLRHELFIIQKDIVQKQLMKLLKMRHEIFELNETLQYEMNSSSISGVHNSKKARGILLFRIVVIVTIASNRLRRLYSHSKYIQSRNGLPSYTLFFPNRKPLHPNQFTQSNNDVASWLRSSSLHLLLTQHLMPITSHDEKNFQGEEKYIELICTCFGKFINAMRNKNPISIEVDYMLVTDLGYGLKRILSKHHHHKFLGNKLLVTDLQTTILDFTTRLHKSEVDRRILTEQCESYEEKLKNMKNELQEINKVRNKTEDELKRKLKERETVLEGMVAVTQFEQACHDLNEALKREEDSQQLLEHQKNEIDNMVERIEKHEQYCREKEKHVAKALYKLKQQDDHIKELHEKFIQIQHEKQKYQRNSEKDRKELDRYIREREALSQYLSNVSTALYESKKQVHFHGNHPSRFDCVLPEILLPDELLSLRGAKLTPELQICQNAVKIFVDAQRDALQQITNLHTEKQVLHYKMAALEDDVTNHKQRIWNLKEQISAACQEDRP